MRFSHQHKKGYFWAWLLLVGSFGSLVSSQFYNGALRADVSNFPISTAVLQQLVEEKNITKLETEFAEYVHIDTFLADIKRCQIITDVSVQTEERGVVLEYWCNSTGNTLHPFFGVFTTDPPQILWGQK